MPKTDLVLVRLPAGVDPAKIQAALEQVVAEDPPSDDAIQPVVCGVWREPSSFCTCVRGDTRKGGFTLGQKFGWWVHSACRKPTAYWGRTLGASLFSVLGRNQLETAPPEFQHTPHETRRQQLDKLIVQKRLGEDHPYDRPDTTTPPTLHPRREP